jgi:hypothetical protein
MLGGVLVCGALNAASYFVRSDGWGNLLDLDPTRGEALGFPLQLWESGNPYGGDLVDNTALAVNIGLALLVAILCGLATLKVRQPLNEWVVQMEQNVAADQAGNLRFSLRGILLLTALIAVAAAGARHLLAGRPEVLGGINLLGPWLLVAIALLPRRIAWEQRVVILVPTTLLLIGVAVAAGASLNRPIPVDRVLLGIFVCWTPQSALAAALITVAVLIFPPWRLRPRQPRRAR